MSLPDLSWEKRTKELRQKNLGSHKQAYIGKPQMGKVQRLHKVYILTASAQ
jgi:hypothetical protein